MAHLLGAEALRLEFPTRVVFDSVTLGVQEGDRIGVVGRNGDGKSTLMRLLAGRMEPDAGRVTRRRGVRLGMLDQADTLDPALTVAEAVVGDAAHHEWAGDARTRDVLAGLVSDIAWDAEISTLSGGQRRRVALAALLVGDWDVVFLDDSRVEAGGRKVLPHVCGTCSISKHRPRPRRSARLRSRFEGSTQADAVDSRPDSGLRDVVRADRLERREGHHRR